MRLLCDVETHQGLFVYSSILIYYFYVLSSLKWNIIDLFYTSTDLGIDKSIFIKPKTFHLTVRLKGLVSYQYSTHEFLFFLKSTHEFLLANCLLTIYNKPRLVHSLNIWNEVTKYKLISAKCLFVAFKIIIYSQFEAFLFSNS
jgi:hypothetical protein